MRDDSQVPTPGVDSHTPPFDWSQIKDLAAELFRSAAVAASFPEVSGDPCRSKPNDAMDGEFPKARQDTV